MFETAFAPRNRNVNGSFIESGTPVPFVLLVSYWGRENGEVRRHQPPLPKKHWGDNPPAFLCGQQPAAPPEIAVAHVLNLKPGPDDFQPETDLCYPERIRRWPSSVEVKPVVVCERGQIQECPPWFHSTLLVLQAKYHHEAAAFHKLLGPTRYRERIAELTSEIVRVSA